MKIIQLNNDLIIISEDIKSKSKKMFELLIVCNFISFLFLYIINIFQNIYFRRIFIGKNNVENITDFSA